MAVGCGEALRRIGNNTQSVLAAPAGIAYQPSMQIEIEHCYSSFLGYPYIAFIWCGNVLVACICKTAEGRYVVSKGVKAP